MKVHLAVTFPVFTFLILNYFVTGAFMHFLVQTFGKKHLYECYVKDMYLCQRYIFMPKN